MVVSQFSSSIRIGCLAMVFSLAYDLGQATAQDDPPPTLPPNNPSIPLGSPFEIDIKVEPNQFYPTDFASVEAHATVIIDLPKRFSECYFITSPSEAPFAVNKVEVYSFDKDGVIWSAPVTMQVRPMTGKRALLSILLP